MTDYNDCLRAAGVDVLDFVRFGSYQGEWAAIGLYDGELVVIIDSYGSCSGCDSLESTDPQTPAEIETFGRGYLAQRMNETKWRDYLRERARYVEREVQVWVDDKFEQHSPAGPTLDIG